MSTDKPLTMDLVEYHGYMPSCVTDSSLRLPQKPKHWYNNVSKTGLRMRLWSVIHNHIYDVGLFFCESVMKSVRNSKCSLNPNAFLPTIYCFITNPKIDNQSLYALTQNISLYKVNKFFDLPGVTIEYIETFLALKEKYKLYTLCRLLGNMSNNDWYHLYCKFYFGEFNKTIMIHKLQSKLKLKNAVKEIIYDNRLLPDTTIQAWIDYQNKNQNSEDESGTEVALNHKIPKYSWSNVITIIDIAGILCSHLILLSLNNVLLLNREMYYLFTNPLVLQHWIPGRLLSITTEMCENFNVRLSTYHLWQGANVLEMLMNSDIFFKKCKMPLFDGPNISIYNGSVMNIKYNNNNNFKHNGVIMHEYEYNTSLFMFGSRTKLELMWRYPRTKFVSTYIIKNDWKGTTFAEYSCKRLVLYDCNVEYLNFCEKIIQNTTVKVAIFYNCNFYGKQEMINRRSVKFNKLLISPITLLMVECDGIKCIKYGNCEYFNKLYYVQRLQYDNLRHTCSWSHFVLNKEYRNLSVIKIFLFCNIYLDNFDWDINRYCNFLADKLEEIHKMNKKSIQIGLVICNDNKPYAGHIFDVMKQVWPSNVNTNLELMHQILQLENQNDYKPFMKEFHSCMQECLY